MKIKRKVVGGSAVGLVIALLVFLTLNSLQLHKDMNLFAVKLEEQLQTERNKIGTLQEQLKQGQVDLEQRRDEIAALKEKMEDSLVTKEELNGVVTRLGPELQRVGQEVSFLENRTIDAVQLYQKASPAVMTVGAGNSRGTGFLYGREKNCVVTSFHLVKNASVVKVTTLKGKTIIARVEETEELWDLAILRLPSPLLDIEPLELTSNPKSPIGGSVLVIGNPLAAFPGSATVGIVSGPNRTFTDFSITFMQFDAFIVPGNSGGPILDYKGEVIAVVSGQFTPPLNFAVPAEHVERLAKDLC